MLGQSDSLHNTPNFIDAHGFSSPESVAIDKSTATIRLFVADFGNSRVLGYRNVATFANGGAADLVIGQPDFISATCNNGGLSGSTLCNPFAVATDASGNLYVADTQNNRILEYDTPFAACAGFPCIGGSANLVFGQGGSFASNGCNFDTVDTDGSSTAIDMCNPFGVAVDSSGNVYVSDQGNSRALEYDNPLAAGGGTPGTPGSAGDVTADLVFGQGNSFTSSGCNFDTEVASRVLPTAIDLCGPRGVALDGSGNLYIADQLNSRVVEYNTPLSTNTTVDRAFGQPNLVSHGCNNGGLGASSLCSPSGVALDASNNLYIADSTNSRVLEYNTPLTVTGTSGSGDETADVVFGQGGSFASSSCNNGGLSPNSLCQADGVAVDPSGDLFVADSVNNRALEYKTPLTVTGTSGSGDETADVVFGQGNFLHNVINFIDALGFSSPGSVAIDESVTPNRLYVADTDNNRVLGYRDIATLVSGSPADLVIGQPDFLSSDCNQDELSASASTLCGPAGIGVDGSGNLYVADESNDRLLEYNNPFAACGGFPCVGGAANKVFGQGGSFTSSECDSDNSGANPSAIVLCTPFGVALDSVGNLYVGDEGNNRVLEYDKPLAPGGGTPGTPGSAGDVTADLVFGQDGSFTSSTTNNGGVSANSLDSPAGVGLDSSSNLYVSDEGNSRVLEYNTPLTVTGTAGSGDTTADRVFGQSGSFSSIGCDSDTGGASPTAIDLCNPFGVALDPIGNLYVADLNNERVLEYNTPLTVTSTAGSGDTTADLVFGQGGSFTSSVCDFDTDSFSSTAIDLCSPQGVALDSIGNLYIADNFNNRVLEFNQPVVLPNPHGDGDQNRDSNRDCDGDCDAHRHRNCDANAYSHCDRYRDGDIYRRRDRDCNEYSDSYRN